MGNHNKDKKTTRESEFMKMIREGGFSKNEIADMLGLTKVDEEGVRRAKGGIIKKMRGGGVTMDKKKKMMRGGAVAKKKMAGGGMAKMAKKKMMRGGVAKKK